MDAELAELRRAHEADPLNRDAAMRYGLAVLRTGKLPGVVELREAIDRKDLAFDPAPKRYFNRNKWRRVNAPPGWYRLRYDGHEPTSKLIGKNRIKRATAAKDSGLSECLLEHYEARQIERRWEPCVSCVAELLMLGAKVEEANAGAGPLFGGAA